MEKRYQVFISSTFTDLIAERQAVLRAVLELDHMPAGMELFPAADDTAWQLIKDVIDVSDYYVLIIGGRYGSRDEADIGYTEKEYDYAITSKKPVIPLLHKNPDNLPREKTDTDNEIWEKLKSFRIKVEKRHTCVYWDSAEDLKAKVIVGLTTAVKRHPAIGWVHADQVPTDATLSELLVLRKRISELETMAETDRTKPPKGTEGLMQGEDTFEINFEFSAPESHYTGRISPSWNQIFAAVAPSMIIEASDYDLRGTFRDSFEQLARQQYQKDKTLKGKNLWGFKFKDDEIDTCIVQLRALGQIRESLRQRSVKDTQKYWALTPHGDYLMVQLRAIRRIDDQLEATQKIL